MLFVVVRAWWAGSGCCRRLGAVNDEHGQAKLSTTPTAQRADGSVAEQPPGEVSERTPLERRPNVRDPVGRWVEETARRKHRYFGFFVMLLGRNVNGGDSREYGRLRYLVSLH
jgi:hypothetical protein